VISQRGVTRNRFLAGSLGVAVGGLLGASAANADGGGDDGGPFAAEASDGTPMLIGTIVGVSARDRIILGRKETAVVVNARTRLWRDRDATLDDFEVGDEVVAYGRPSGDEFVAERVEPVYHQLVGRVVAVDGDALEITGGRVRFLPSSLSVNRSGSRSPVKASDFRVGDVIDLMGRKTRGSDDLIVSRVVG
jgi:ribosomal protein L21E